MIKEPWDKGASSTECKYPFAYAAFTGQKNPIKPDFPTQGQTHKPLLCNDYQTFVKEAFQAHN